METNWSENKTKTDITVWAQEMSLLPGDGSWTLGLQVTVIDD